MTALQATIWIAMLCFAAGETGRVFTRRGHAPPQWAWWAFTGGALLAIAHTLLAFATVHRWSHADAVLDTAAETNAVFGVSVGAGVYVNYLFFAVWLADALWWRFAAAGYERPAAITWILRAFYMVIIFNAVVVFVDGARRLAGLVVISWLARIWSPASNHQRG